MNTEDLYLQAIIENATDDLPRRIYSDWLEERGDPVSSAKAEFLRLTAEDAAANQDEKGPPDENRRSSQGKGREAKVARRNLRRQQRKVRRKRLQELAAKLDTDWLAMVSRLPIEACQRDQESMPREFQCHRRWEELQATDNRTVRFCDSCQHSVHYCDTITEAREHADEGHCIAVDLGVIRREGDLRVIRQGDPRRIWLGQPDPESLRRESELLEPDPVSAEREQKKRKKAEGAG